ncbi:MAG: polysaccharide deacetylase family protein [Bacillota bacterium]
MKLARYVNSYLKQKRKEEMRKHLSPVRRIERFFPPSNGRFCAMTFDDGPSRGQINPGEGELTPTLLDILAKYGAKGTFDVVGTTEHNYPDEPGKLGTPQWGGIRHDHYPDFGQDHLAGVVHNKDLVRRILDEGHELTNHTYSHVAFGPSLFVYGRRAYLPDLAAVVEDVRKLNDLVEAEFGYRMMFSRPPHFIDKTKDGYSSYDAYRQVGVHYLAASFEGGGWQPGKASYEETVREMVEPFEQALGQDADFLNGQIIFEKDGYNMSKETPVVDGLPRQLELLREHGYKVVTVRELMAMSPFNDLADTHPYFEIIRRMDQSGYCVGYRDNSFQPDRVLTRGELAVMLVRQQDLADSYDKPSYADVPNHHVYYREIEAAGRRGYFKHLDKKFRPDGNVGCEELEKVKAQLLFEVSSKMNDDEFRRLERELREEPVNHASENEVRRADALGDIGRILLSK